MEKKFDLEKFVDKINKIGKIIAFIGIVLSVLIKLNKIFGFFDKKSDNSEEETQNPKTQEKKG